MLELLQEGNIGVMKAVTSFAKEPIGEFSAHAAGCIEQEIARAIQILKSAAE